MFLDFEGKGDARSAGEGLCRRGATALRAEGYGIDQGPRSGPGSEGSKGSEGSEGKVSPSAMSMYAAFGGSAARGSENRTTGPAARWKCTPIPLRGLPPVGEVLATLSLEMLMSSKAERH